VSLRLRVGYLLRLVADGIEVLPFAAPHLQEQLAEARHARTLGTKRAFAAVSRIRGMTKYYYRGDSACHKAGLVNWLQDEKREGGTAGGQVGCCLPEGLQLLPLPA